MKPTASETADALKEAGEATAAQARKTFVRVGNQAAQYVQDQPLKSLLIAVATGAAIALLAGALSRHRHDR